MKNLDKIIEGFQSTRSMSSKLKMVSLGNANSVVEVIK